MNIVLLGAPGSGKGTQAGALRESTELVHVATGDLFRKHLGEETSIGLLAKSYMDKGQLVPDSVTISMVRDRMDSQDVQAGVLFDGFPRTLEQAEALDELMAELGQSIRGAILIDVPEEELIDRLSGRRICKQCQTPFHIRFKPFKVCPLGECHGEHLYQREDDKPDTVGQRLEVYSAQTAPVIEYFRQSKRLITVDGIGSVSQITKRMRQALTELSGTH